MMMAEKIADRIRGKAALARSTAKYYTSKRAPISTPDGVDSSMS